MADQNEGMKTNEEIGLRNDASPLTRKILLQRQQIQEKLKSGSILQNGKVILPPDLKEEMHALSVLTKSGSESTSAERHFAAAQLSKVVKSVAGVMLLSKLNYRPNTIGEATEIVTHNSGIGNELLGVFVDQIDDPDKVIASGSVYNLRLGLGDFLSLSSAFVLDPTLAGNVTSKISQQMQQGVFSEADSSVATVLAMVEPRP